MYIVCLWLNKGLEPTSIVAGFCGASEHFTPSKTYNNVVGSSCSQFLFINVHMCITSKHCICWSRISIRVNSPGCLQIWRLRKGRSHAWIDSASYGIDRISNHIMLCSKDANLSSITMISNTNQNRETICCFKGHYLFTTYLQRDIPVTAEICPSRADLLSISGVEGFRLKRDFFWQKILDYGEKFGFIRQKDFSEQELANCWVQLEADMD